jgi:hypothetical protein
MLPGNPFTAAHLRVPRRADVRSVRSRGLIICCAHTHSTRNTQPPPITRSPFRFSRVTVWNDANGASFCYVGHNTTLSDSDVVYARASWAWWGGGRVFSQRDTWSAEGLTVERLRISDPLPSLNIFQFASSGHAADLVFRDVSIAAFSAERLCPAWGGGCNCVPPCGAGGALPDGVPNLLTGNVSNVSFDNITFLGGLSIATVLESPAFNVTRNGSVVDIFVDGRRVL